jgi:hypothetical protein
MNVGALIWTPGEIEAAFKDRIPPKTMRFEARDITYRGNSGDRELDRMLEQAWSRQVPPADVAVAWDWVEDERLLLLEQVRVRWKGDEAITVSGVIENVDLRNSGAAQMSLTAWGARNLVIRANVDRFLSAGIAHLLRDVRADEVALALNDIPNELLDASSKEAVRQLLANRNTLRGSIELRAAAKPGLGPSRFLPLVTGAIGFGDAHATWSLFEGVKVDINYVPR